MLYGISTIVGYLIFEIELILYKVDLALNNQQRLICHKPNQPTNQLSVLSVCLSVSLPLSLSLTIYIYIYIRGTFIKFTDFFLQTFEIVVDSWKFTMLLLYILWGDWPIFMIPCLNEQLQQQLEYTQLKPDCHSWWISKMQSGHEDTLEERYIINLCFKLGKNAQKQRMECFRLLLEHLAWIEHQLLSGIRDSRKAESLWGMIRGCGGSKEVNSPELIGQRIRLFDQDGHQDSSSASL